MSAPTTSPEPSAVRPGEAAAVKPTLRSRAELSLAAEARAWTVLSYAAVGLGCLFRLLRWIDNPALWLDEAFVALNLMDKSFAGVLGQLHYLQSAPPGFLIVEEAAESFLGDAERSLRLFPLLAALASVFLFAYVARRVLPPPAAALAILLFAAGEPLLERAAEVKPYSIDLAVAALLAALTLWVVDAPPAWIVLRTAVLGAVGVVVLWFSFPAAFSLAAALVALGIYASEIRSRRLLVASAVVGVVSLATFGAVYAVASSNVSRITAAIFGGGEDDSPVGRFDVVQDAWSAFVNPGGFDNGTNALAALLACFGVVALARRASLHLLVLFATPPVLAVGADLLDRYPLGGRFSLFLVPCLLILIARGAQALIEWSRHPFVVAGGLTVFLLASPLALAVHHGFEPPAREDLKPLLRHLAQEWQEGDSLYVYAQTQYAFRYYATCENCNPSGDPLPFPIRLAPAAPDDPDPPALESVPPELIVGSTQALLDPQLDLDRLPRGRRVWLLFSHVLTHDAVNPESALVTGLEHEGEPLEKVSARGARLYLFDRPVSERP